MVDWGGSPWHHHFKHVDLDEHSSHLVARFRREMGRIREQLPFLV